MSAPIRIGGFLSASFSEVRQPLRPSAAAPARTEAFRNRLPESAGFREAEPRVRAGEGLMNMKRSFRSGLVFMESVPRAAASIIRLDAGGEAAPRQREIEEVEIARAEEVAPAAGDHQ